MSMFAIECIVFRVPGLADDQSRITCIVTATESGTCSASDKTAYLRVAGAVMVMVAVIAKSGRTRTYVRLPLCCLRR
jgi:hypothetical protein